MACQALELQWTVTDLADQGRCRPTQSTVLDTKRLNSVLKPQLLADIGRGGGHIKDRGANFRPLITGLVIAGCGLKEVDVMGTVVLYHHGQREVAWGGVK